jgi:nucleotidyltransferase-like protein
MKADSGVGGFARLVEALDPWLDEVVIVGGWAHRLYRLHPRAQALTYPPLTTLDGDVAVPPKVASKEANIRDRLLAAGFQEEFQGEHRPPATHYYLGREGGFYAEFLTPLVGSEYDQRGERKATREVGGISSQQLRYIDILLLKPWTVDLDEAHGYPFAPAKQIQIANPVSFLAQKILIQDVRGRHDRAKDTLYIHDTIETFAGNLVDLQTVFTNEIRPQLHRKQLAGVRTAADTLFAGVNDTVRGAVLMPTGRKLTSEALIETCRAGLKAIFV